MKIEKVEQNEVIQEVERSLGELDLHTLKKLPLRKRLLLFTALLEDASQTTLREWFIAEPEKMTQHPDPAKGQLLSLPQVAKRLGCSRITAWRHAKEGDLPTITFKGYQRVYEADLRNFKLPGTGRPNQPRGVH